MWHNLCGDVMDRRKAKLIVGKAGGTAGKGAKTYKVSLPNKWVEELDLSRRAMDIEFDGERIVISPRLGAQEFWERGRALGHELMKLDYYDGERLCTVIVADFDEKRIVAENRTDQIVKTAFGNNETPTWEDFLAFLEERCVPRARAGIREYLDEIGVERYEPLEIVKRTSGRMAEDDQWLKCEGYR